MADYRIVAVVDRDPASVTTYRVQRRCLWWWSDVRHITHVVAGGVITSSVRFASVKEAREHILLKLSKGFTVVRTTVEVYTDI